MEKRFTASIRGQELTIETGKLATLAGGSVTVRSGDTIVLATATASKDPRPGADFFPLTVDFEERLYAAGKFPGGFFKREGRPTEASILLCRLVDRPLRPLFPKGFRNDVQVILTALSADGEHYVDILSIIAASAAVSISDIPFGGPLGAVRVGYIDGQFVFDPTATQMAVSSMDLRLAGTADAVLMVEAGANEQPEELMLEAIRQGHEAMQDVIRLQVEMARQIGKEKRQFVLHRIGEPTVQAVEGMAAGRLESLLATPMDKTARNTVTQALRDEVKAALVEGHESGDVVEVFEDLVRMAMRRQVLSKHIRADGRALTEIRPITCEVGLLPRAHGSGLFTRGETQVLSIATLGTAQDVQIVEGLEFDGTKRYMHHYNFPPYSTGETKPLRGAGRREIGHGALAERALMPVIPAQDKFPYTVRVVSEVLSSNGSSSMGSVCGSTLSLMDAGVPIAAPVAGVAMGLIKEGSDFAVLTDILGMEDHLGDMDFKVAGTRKGVTALQMDMKVKGLDYAILGQALEQARAGRFHILGLMEATISTARPELSQFAPRITTLKIPVDKIGALIGPGGKTVRGIQEQTGVKIDIEEDGTVFIASSDGAAAKAAEAIVRGLFEEPEIGKIYTGKVVRTTDFGAFVEFMPGKDGLVHISQLADYRVPSVEDVVKVGDEIMVMVIDVDPTGRVKLSRQAVLEGWTADEARERDRKPSGGGRPRGPEGPGGSRGGPGGPGGPGGRGGYRSR
jgi:polyribonucleotide nucleotidyltransferase